MSIRYDESYEGQLRKFVGNRRLIIPAVGAFLQDEKGHILLIRRRDNDQWGFPVGALELGESILDCLRREVKEETGLDVISATPMAIYSEPRFQFINKYGNKLQMFTVVFLVTEWSGTISRETDETTDARFFDLNELPDLPSVYEERLEDLKEFNGKLILK